MNKIGQCDLSIVESVIHDISKKCENKIVIIKSTSPPETTKNFSDKFSNLSIVFNPEFLTEKNYINDFKNQEFIVLGGNEASCNSVKRNVPTSISRYKIFPYVF